MSDEPNRRPLPALRSGALGLTDAKQTGYGLNPRELAARIHRPGSQTGFVRDKQGRLHPIYDRPERLPEAKPPDPTVGELQAAAAEKEAYFRYLNGQGPKPEPPRYGHLWPE